MAGCSKLCILSASLFACAWLLDFSLPPRTPPLVNYDKLVYFDPFPSLGLLEATGTQEDQQFYLAPWTKNEVIKIIKSVAATASKGGVARRKLRVVGAGHSWSSIARSDDLHISLCNYKGLVSVDKNTHQATFKGGTTLNEVNIILEKHGLAMSQLGSISGQTVAGAIATGTHGSGVAFGNLATFVTRLELITAQGEVLNLSANDSSKELFMAAQVNLGLLGIVTEVTFQCEPAFNLEETRSVLSLHDCLSNMEQLVSSGEHVKMWIEVFSEVCVVYNSSRTMEKPRDNPSPAVGLILNVLYEFFINGIAWMPGIVPDCMNLLFKYGNPLPPYNRVDVSYKVFNIPSYFPNHNEAEVVLKLKDCVPAIRELKKFVEEENIPLNFITEVRFVRGDNIPMSPNYRRDSCHITLCINSPSHANRLRYFTGMFNLLSHKGFMPRVHWGKYFDLSPDVVSFLYPGLRSFLEIRETLDPHQIFVNRLLSKSLGI